MIHITIKDWTHECGDGCCYTWGTSVTLNGEVLSQNAPEDLHETLTQMMLALGYKQEEFEVETI